MQNSKLVFTGKDNVLPYLSTGQAARIKARMSKERKIAVEEITEIFPEDLIRYSNPRNNALDAENYRLSHAVKTARKMIETVVVCEETGVNIGIEIPRIPGFFLTYTSPLAEYSNCRLLANRGYGYLINLDTQVLAGIAMVLAENYKLFVFSSTANGMEKNAILRSCGKSELINCILCIERNVHSHNYESLPQISFLPANDLTQGTMETRMHNWLALVVKALRPVSVAISQNSAEVSIENLPAGKITGGYIKISEANKIAKQKAAAEKAEQKEKVKALEHAIKLTRALFKDGIISIQLRNFLTKTFDPETFDTVDSTFKTKLSLKLTTLNVEDGRIKVLQDALAIKVKSAELEDFFSPIEVPVKTAEQLQNYIPSEDSPSSITSASNIASVNTSTPATEVSSEADGTMIGKNAEGTAVYVPTNLWNSMGTLQRVIYKRKNGVIG